MILNPANLAFAFYGLKKQFQAVFDATPVHWPALATEIPSMTEQEFHAWVKAIPELRKWVGERRINNLAGAVQALKNDLYEGTVAIPRTKFEDDQYGLYAPQLAQQIGRRSRQWPDLMVAAAMIAGETALCHDGQPFFSASHPVNPDVAGSATQANLFTAKPLTAQSFSDVRAAMESLKDEGGVPLELEFDTLIVPPNLKNTALQLANAETIAQAFGGNQAAQQTNVLKGTIKNVIVFPRLNTDSATSWYLAAGSTPVKPFIYQNRVAPEFTYLNKPDDPGVFLQDEYQYGVRARGAAGYGPYFLCAKVKAA